MGGGRAVRPPPFVLEVYHAKGHQQILAGVRASYADRFIIGFIWPFIWGIFLSFQRFTTVSKTTFVGIQNYISVFQDSTFLHAFGFTAAFTVVSTVLINVCAFAIAIVLTRGIKAPTSSVPSTLCPT